MGGPTVNPIEKQIPTKAKDFDLCKLLEISLIIAIDICTLPSVKPPIMREDTNIKKLLANIHKIIETALPI